MFAFGDPNASIEQWTPSHCTPGGLLGRLQGPMGAPGRLLGNLKNAQKGFKVTLEHLKTASRTFQDALCNHPVKPIPPTLLTTTPLPGHAGHRTPSTRTRKARKSHTNHAKTSASFGLPGAPSDLDKTPSLLGVYIFAATPHPLAWSRSP